MAHLDLELIKNKSKEILDTLPLSHYLKFDTIEIVLDESAPTSYFNPECFNIHIALTNILDALVGFEKKEKETLDELKFEQIIRGLLYHEISHAILTPKDVKAVCSRLDSILTPNLVNILEDERIETILKGYYLLVDFRKNLYLVCDKSEPRNFEHFVFNAVRLKCCDKYQEIINNKVRLFIQSTLKINSRCGEYLLLREMADLAIFLKEIWDKIEEERKHEEEEHSSSAKDSADDREDNPEKHSSSSEESEKSLEKEDTEGESEEKSDIKDDVDSISTKGEPEETSGTSSKEEPTLVSEEEQKDLVEEAFKEMKVAASYYGKSMKLSDFNSDSKTRVELMKCIVRNNGVGVQDKPALYGYTGRFDAKKFMNDHNDSYKWFKKPSFEDSGVNAKKNKKKVLNIWLDQSGSFAGNDDEMNKALKALAEIEAKQKNFEWKLIKLTCDVNVVKDKEQRFSKSYTGNALPVGKMRNVYNEVNPNKNEFNLVLFDGNANSLDFGCGCERRNPRETYSFEALKVFDNNRTIFISEPHNACSIRPVCPNARDIISTRDYVSTLATNIIKALDLLF